MAKRVLRKLTSSKPKRLRPLSFDKLEDRRLLAGLNISIFEDVNSSGSYEHDIDSPVALRVAYLDTNHSGTLDSGERFGISDANGLVSFGDLGVGDYSVRLLGNSNPAIPVTLDDVDQELSFDVPVTVDSGNMAPAWTSGAIDFDGVEDTALQISSQDLLPLVANEPQDPTFFFVVSQPTHGQLNWSLSSGGTYTPNADFFGTDTFLVKVFDGQAWSDNLLVNLNIAAVDDPPTALHVTFAQSVPENTPFALLGTYQIDDVDGGTPVFTLDSPTLYEAINGEIRLRAGQTLNFEQANTVSVGLSLAGQAGQNSGLSASGIVPVSDQNDPSTGIEFDGIPEIMEFRAGAKFGALRVIDEDAHDHYAWQLSDDRFYVDDNNNLRLLANAFLETRDQTEVHLILTATSAMGGDSVDSEITIKVDQAPPSYQNPSFPMDVNNDGNVTSLDVLAIINRFNSRGSRDLSGPPPSGPFDYVDVNGDRTLSSLDVLVVVNYLNSIRRNTGSGEGGNHSQIPAPSVQQPSNSLFVNDNLQVNEDVVQQVAAAASTEYQQKLRRSL